MPTRIIKETVKTSPQIDELSWFEEVVFYRAIVTADDYGCLDGRTVLLKNELFPTRDNVTKKSVEDAVAKLVSVGLLREYNVNGMPYLFFPSWEKHQRIRNKRRKFPDPSGTCQTNDGQMSADCRPESNPIQNESESKTNPTRARAGATAGAQNYAQRNPIDYENFEFVDLEKYAETGAIYAD